MTDDALERVVEKLVRDVASLESRVRDLKLEARGLLGMIRERNQMTLFDGPRLYEDIPVVRPRHPLR